MNDWCVFSSDDMKTWTEHPTPLHAADFAWARGDAWASQVIERMESSTGMWPLNMALSMKSNRRGSIRQPDRAL